MSETLSNASSDNDLLQNIELGSKIVLLMRILKESERVGDKVLVFSQSLLSLDLIETFLEVNLDFTWRLLVVLSNYQPPKGTHMHIRTSIRTGDYQVR